MSQSKFAKFNNVHKDMIIVFLKWLDTMEGTNFNAPQYYEIFIEGTPYQIRKALCITDNENCAFFIE